MIKFLVQKLLNNKTLIVDCFFFFIFISFLIIALITFYTNAVYWESWVDTLFIIANAGAVIIVIVSIIFYFSRYKKYYQYVFIFPFTIYIFIVFLFSDYKNPPVRLALILIVLSFSFTKAEIKKKIMFVLITFSIYLLIAFLQTLNILEKYLDNTNSIFKNAVINIIILGLIIYLYLYKELVQKNNMKKITSKELSLLTEKEKEIVFFLLQKKTYAEIADDVFRSKRTIQFHAINIFKKLNVKNRHELYEKYRND